MLPDPFAHARPNWSPGPSSADDDRKAADGSSNHLGRAPLAATAPILRCYEEAVQEPVVECGNLDSLYSHAQLEDSDRSEARVLREDFCSTAIVASTWLALDPRNRSQGVDIDYDALAHTHQRLGADKVILLQSPKFAKQAGSTAEGTRKIELEPSPGQGTDAAASSSANGEADATTDLPPTGSSTWAPGAATERFDRKLAKKLEKEAKKLAKKAKDPSTSTAASRAPRPRMTLLHSDVLDLPVPAPGAEQSSDAGSMALDPPDIIASLNYAMAYFHDRATLLAYLRMALRTLRPKTGVFITDMFAGPSTGERYEDQDELWSRFRDEIGFGRGGGDGQKQVVLKADRTKPRAAKTSSAVGVGGGPARTGAGRAAPLDDDDDDDNEAEKVLEVMAPSKPQDIGTRAEWPRGKLKMVRTGSAHGGFEYWREDGPVDLLTNRFRMSLSFRFSDGSWCRDVFSYGFRIWSLRELTEAMEEVGFVRVKVFALPSNVVEEGDAGSSEDNTDSAPSCPTSPTLEPNGGHTGGTVNDDQGLEGMANLLRKTEKAERNKTFYRGLERGEKLFSEHSFGAYIVACAP
ncbi:uncharacterized protein PFL1_02478 [Pseudozyma flocculosa PF-1]|nr:uncharacterized protein PFL1_02478 [Pseudozyma flocculosa PF-1]EPQ29805.1 hypothetical protein PFL1_02478 [Pseudozyma flocculosa PF-1]